MKTYTIQQMKDIYNDYRNNYITISRVANDYNTTINTLERMFKKVNIYYSVIGTTITIFKSVSDTTLEAIEYIKLDRQIQLLNTKEIVQTKYPNYILNRIGL